MWFPENFPNKSHFLSMKFISFFTHSIYMDLDLNQKPTPETWYLYDADKFYQDIYSRETPPSSLQEVASFDYSSIDPIPLFRFLPECLEEGKPELEIPIKINQKEFKFYMFENFNKEYKANDGCVLRKFNTQIIEFILQSENDFGLFKDEEKQRKYGPHIQLEIEIKVGVNDKNNQNKVFIERKYMFQVKTTQLIAYSILHPLRTDFFCDTTELLSFFQKEWEEEILQVIEAQLKAGTLKRMKLDRILERRLAILEKEEEKRIQDEEKIRDQFSWGYFVTEYKENDWLSIWTKTKKKGGYTPFMFKVINSKPNQKKRKE